MKLALVPVEPSEAMVLAPNPAVLTMPGASDIERRRAQYCDDYAAMLSARDTGPEDALFEVVRAAAAVERLNRPFPYPSGSTPLERYTVKEMAEKRLAAAIERARAHPALRELMDEPRG